MQEGHAVSPGAGSWFFIDETDAGLAQAFQLGVQVGGAEGHVVEAGPAPLQEPGYTGTGRQGLDELQGHDAGVQECHGDALGRHGLDLGTCSACQLLEFWQGVADGRHRDGDVVDGQFEVWHGLVGRGIMDPRNVIEAWPPGYRRCAERGRSGGMADLVKVTDGNFDEEIGQGSGLTMVDFWAEWCGPCRLVAPIVEELAEAYAGRLRVGKLDVDSNQRTTARFNVRSIPSILFFKDGQHVDTVVGAVPKPHLEGKIKEYLD